MTDAPLYVIVHRRDNGRTVEDQVRDLRPYSDLADAQELAADLQSEVAGYGRPNDTYRVAELRYVDTEATR
jgi:hypothetical protein